jgi:hypothetical protein
MDGTLRKLLESHSDNVSMQYQVAGITGDTVKQFILREMSTAIAEQDWEAWYTLFGLVRTIADPNTRADALNCLLVMPGHELHQEIARAIQELRDPSSVPYIRQMLVDDFAMLEYTCSDATVIAKWFSHALADINTPEAIALIEEFSRSGNPGIAEEMAYRLKRTEA